MSWLARLFRPQIELSPALAERVRAWREQPAASEKAGLSQARFIVVDVETSGLDMRRDRLLSVGACAVEALRLRAGENYATILRRGETNERDNILIHGIGPQAQAAGEVPEESLMGFLEFAGRHPLVAFHASFDQTMLDRALRAALGVRLSNPWLDLAHLGPALFPEARLAHAGLDDWLDHFGLRAHARHRALDDAFATAELFLIMLARARARGLTSVSALLAAGEQQARLVPGGGAGGA
ncbi:MAG: 3'-5' exonuclease [Gammaproteobacteria bacterium]|nr:3'-5' exonuclease [Gammaproteobacteria bacterium]